MSVDCVEGDGEVGEIGESEGFGCYIEEMRRWNGRDVKLQTWKQDQRTLTSQFHLKVLQGAMELAHDQIRSQCYEILDLTQDVVEEVAQDFDWPAESDFHPTLPHSSTRKIFLADPTRYQAEIAKCGHFWKHRRQDLKNVGKGLEHGCKKVKKVGKNIYKAGEKGVKETGKAIAKVAEKTFDAIVDGGEAVADAGKAAGKAVGKGTKEVVHFVKEHKTEILITIGVVALVCGVYIIAEEAFKGAAAEIAAAAAGAAVGANQGKKIPSRRREDGGQSDDFDTTPFSGNIPGNSNLPSLALTTPQPDDSWIKGGLGDQAPFNTPKDPDISLDQHPRPWAAGSSYQKTLDELMTSHGSRVNPSNFDATTSSNFRPPEHEASTSFQNTFGAILGDIQRMTTNTPQLAAAPFQNLSSFREAFGQDGNTLSQSAFVDFLETVGKEALYTLPEMPVSDSGASQRPTGFLESLERFIAAMHPANAPSNGFPFLSSELPPPPEPFPIRSCKIQTEGTKRSDKRVMLLNGMNTSFEEAMHHLNYFKEKAGDVCINGIYNHTNGVVGDLLEIFGLNYAGIAPVTGNLLLEDLREFHNENKHKPDAKYLLVAYSMGTILAEATLEKAPQEIRDRVIYFGLGTAKVVREGLCYKAFNYASTKDYVHYGENLTTIFGAAFVDTEVRTKMLQQFIENKEQLIRLNRHPDAKGIMDHDIESPTLEETIKERLEDYLKS